MIYHLNFPTGIPFWPLTPDSPSGVKWLAQYLEASGEAQRTPLSRVHCGGITAQHFIISSLSGSTELNSGHTRGRTGSQQRKKTRRGASMGELEGAEVWIKNWKKKGITQQWSHPHLWDKQKTNWSDKGHNRREKKWTDKRKPNPCLREWKEKVNLKLLLKTTDFSTGGGEI